MSDSKVTRRDFVATTGKAAFGAVIVPRFVLGRGYQAPSDTLNVAIVGFGGMGSVNAQEVAKTDNVVAVADVDLAFSERMVNSKLRDKDGKDLPAGIRLKEQWDRAKKYTDYREMLQKEPGIDAVLIATPDHLHAIVARDAMQMGKHVYVQKPLTYSVREARVLSDLARANPKLATQMGNQGHSGEDARRVNELIQAGVIGAVREVHVWTNRPVVYWPQGIPRPQAAPVVQQNNGQPSASWNMRRVNETLAQAMAANALPKPEGLRWDLYLGPCAEDIEYHPIYHPFNWRGWIEFGVGAIGDMGAHLIDHPYWALGLTFPSSVEATSTQWGTLRIPPDPNAAAGTPAARARFRPVSYPLATTVHYEFAARGDQPAIKMLWYDGGLYPPRPDLLPDDVELKDEGGVIYIGEKGIMIHDTYGTNPRIWPSALMEAAQAVPKTYPRITDTHELNWIKACKGEATPSCPIEYASRLTEVMLLGIAALRAGQGKKLYYDGWKMEFRNAPDANRYLTREYRKGWEV